jgi:hypothetical protein
MVFCGNKASGGIRGVGEEGKQRERGKRGKREF